jgi:hypothetical protein
MNSSSLQTLSRYLPRSVEHRIRRRIHAQDSSDRMAFLRQMRSTVFSPGYTLTSCDRLRCLFVHIPKCAGLSIAKSLFGNLGPGHIRAEEYQLLYSPQELKKLFKFTFIRNPWDRLASAFFYLKSGGINELDKNFAERHLSAYADFEPFVMNWLNSENIFLYYHFQPQVYYINVNKRRFALDFVGRFERLEYDYRTVCRHLGLSTDLAWENRTRTDVSDYKSLYNDAMVKKVASVYAQDVRSLDYTFA